MVKPLYSGHHWDLKIVSVIERGVCYIEVLPKLAYFASKTCSRVLEYSAINPKVSRVRCQEKKELKDNVLEDIVLEATDWRVFAMCERAKHELAKNAVAVVRSKYHFKEDVVCYVQQNPHYCICVSIPTPLRFGNLCNLETRQPWRGARTGNL